MLPQNVWRGRSVSATAIGAVSEVKQEGFKITNLILVCHKSLAYTKYYS